MSYSINATQARWFGFQPKYVWDDFVVEHSVVARKIKTVTFPMFMEIEDCETRIKMEARKIMKEEEIDLLSFTSRSKLRREDGRKQMAREMVKEMEEEGLERRKKRKYEEETVIVVDEESEEEEEHEEVKGFTKEEVTEYEKEMSTLMINWEVKMEEIKWGEEEKMLKYIWETHLSEGEDFDGMKAFSLKTFEMYRREKEESMKRKEEVETLKEELKTCQLERDNWRGKYMGTRNAIES